jgi:chromate transport protein ChrA
VNTVIEVDVAALAMLAGTIIPLLTGLLTKLKASSQVKALVAAVLSIAAGVVTELQMGDGKSTLAALVVAGLAAYTTSGVSYTNLWKPIGAAETVANIIPLHGIGKAVEVEAPPEHLAA